MEERTTVARKSENGQMLQTIKVWQGDSLHHFSDASQDGYGQVTYLRILDEKGYIKCSLVMAKSRVAPTKFVSIARLSIKVSTMLRRELTIYPTIKERFLDRK